MTEQQRYDVLRTFPRFELRRYPAHLVAEVEVDGSFADAGNKAFGILAGYISGRNSARGKVAMTAPVVQEASTEIAMTSPVVQESGPRSGRHVVGFVMPAEFTKDTLPLPSDPRVKVREVPAEVAAVKRFTGRWTEAIYLASWRTFAAPLLRRVLRSASRPGSLASTRRGRHGSCAATRSFYRWSVITPPRMGLPEACTTGRMRRDR